MTEVYEIEYVGSVENVPSIGLWSVLAGGDPIAYFSGGAATRNADIFKRALETDAADRAKKDIASAHTNTPDAGVTSIPDAAVEAASEAYRGGLRPVSRDIRKMLTAALPHLNVDGHAAAKLTYWQEGTAIIEECLKKAIRADPQDAPIPLVGIEAARWHNAQAEAFRHALEMMGVPSGETIKATAPAPVDDLT